MGNKYIFEFCVRCDKETWHKVFKKYGKAEKGKSKGKKGLKRIVTWCLQCQKRRVNNLRKDKCRRRHINFRI